MKNPRKEIRTEILIETPVARVWKVLTDFAAYPEWNPFIKNITGNPVVGSKITARIEPPGAGGMTFKPTVLVFSRDREFRWLGNFVLPGLFDGEHIFELTEQPDGTTILVQREQFGGILVPMFKKMLDNNTVAGFNAMNEALKARAENPVTTV